MIACSLPTCLYRSLWQRVNHFYLLLAGYLPLLFAAVIVAAFTVTSTPVLAQAPEAAKPSDVRIVIDISGSMKKNDPKNLRRPALDMLVKLLPEESKAGVWTFGQYVNMLVKHRPVDSAWKQEADNDAGSINSIAQFTNIGEALEKAAYDKSYSTKDQFQTHVILLTDGMVDISRDPAVNNRERQRIINEVLPSYQQAGYRIHTVSLSDKADKQLMDKLALSTDGKSVIAKTADELMKVFLEVFDQAVPKEELPFDGNSFATDSSIEEFTALIFRQPSSPETKIISPDKTEYSQTTQDPTVNWYRTDKYDLVTIKQPLEGEWRVLADIEPQSRITVVSDLSLAVKPIPANVQLNEKIDLSVVLREENKVVKRAEFLDLLDIDVMVKQSDSGQDWSQRLSDGLVPGNGVYRSELDYFKKEGQYDITIKVDGKSFQRQLARSINVRSPFAVDTSTVEKEGKTLFKITVIPQDQKIDLEKTKVVGKLKDPTGSSSIQNFSFTADQQWELLLTPKAEGVYYLTLRITTSDERGKESDIIPKALSFKYPQEDGFFKTLVEPEPEVEPVEEVKPAVPEETSKDPEEEEPVEELDSSELMDEEESDGAMTQWVLYGVLAVVNVLIILVIYLLYRKLFGKKAVLDEDDDDDDVKEKSAPAAAAAAAPAFEEPPMDEMMVDELDDDIDLADDSSTDSDISLEASEAIAAGEADSAGFDEDPEFSLDDFAPDELDDDSEDKK
ncbi:MAG: VWA domain-containing protein [Cellvibrionaceae bacterium]